MTPFRERNPVKIGAVSIAVIVAMLLAAFNAGSLPLIGGGDTYHANFSEVSNLRPDDEVRIAGVRVGKVTGIDLEGDHVKVTFKIKTKAQFGSQTGAALKIKTLLGSMYVALEPKGSGQLAEGSTIPVARTTSPYDIVQAFTGLAERSQEIDLNGLKDAVNSLASATSETPVAFKNTLKGLSALSENVAARDAQLNTLLKNLRGVSGILADRDEDIVALMKDASTLLNAVVARREAVHQLLISTSTLSKELTALVRQSRADLKPALQNLQTVTRVLLKNQANIDDSLRLLAPFSRVLANAFGSGPWWDTWVKNLPPGGVPQSPEVY